MSKKFEAILKILESEKNQKNIKKFNIFLSILAVFFIGRLYSEFNLTSLKISNTFIFANYVPIWLYLYIKPIKY